MPTSKRPARLVVDANPILAALLGGQARRIFFEAGLQEFAVPVAVIDEVREHLPQVATKIGAARSILEYALELLPVTTYSASAYRQTTREATRRIGERDPSDVHVLALSLSLGVPIWTNDRDFEVAGVEYFTTAQLLTIFFGSSPR